MVYIALALLGLALGSFVNALVWRIHELQTNKKLKVAEKQALSMLKGRSMCPHCTHTLSILDLIPVLSWLSLGGKCRYCKNPIPDSPFVELAVAALFVLSYIYWPISLHGLGLAEFVVWLPIVTALVALFVYDLKWMLLPNKIIYPTMIFVSIFSIVEVLFFKGTSRQLLDSVFAFLVGGGIFYLLFQISAGKWIGGGDVKLGALLGLIVGQPSLSLLVIFLASVLGTIAALPLLVRGTVTPRSRLPFGPFLIMACFITKLFGASIVSWYRRKYLLI